MKFRTGNKTFTALLSLLGLLGVDSAHPSDRLACDRAYGGLEAAKGLYLSRDPVQLLGRRLSAEESRALDSFSRAFAQEYTPQDYFAEAKALKKAGFSKDDIEKLRRARIIHPESMMFGSDTPAQVIVQKVRLKELDSEVVRQLKADPSLEVQYVRDSDGVFHVVPDLNLERSDGNLLMLEDGSRRIAVMEAGAIGYLQKSKSPEFRPRYRIDPDMPENESAFAELRKKPGFESVVAPKEKRNPGTVTLDCMALMSRQAAGQGFVLSKMVGSAALTTAGIALTEPFAHRLDSEAGRSIVMADFIGSVLSSGIHASVGRRLVTGGASDAKAIGYRIGTSYGIIAIQNPIYKSVMEGSGNVDKEQSEKKAKAISTYDASYATGRAFVSHKIDKAFLGSLPEKFYESCRKKPTMTRLVLTPGMIRFYESGLFAFIYYGGRSLFIGQ